MAKPSSDYIPEPLRKILSPTATISEGFSPEAVRKVLSFFSTVSVSALLPDHSTTKDFYSELFAGLLKLLTIESGRVTCLLTIKPAIIAQLIVDAYVVRKGRNLTVVAVYFNLEKTQQLIYQACATLYNMPLAKL